MLQALTAITNAIPTQTSLTNAPLRARCDTKQVIIPSARRDPPASTTSHAETADRDEKRFSDGSASSTLFVALVAVVAGIGGTIAALHYHGLGLTLSHYDARGHLVVARRIIDSLTPGWQQIGAVWLPLPHLLNALPVQVDAWYRSGASAVAISIAAFAVTVGAIAWIVLAAHRIESRSGRGRGGVRVQPERAVPAVHADDRAAVDGPDHRWPWRCCSTGVHEVGRVLWTRLTLRSPGGSEGPALHTDRLRVRAGLPDAIRSVARDGRGAGRRCMDPVAARRVTRRRRAPRGAPSPLFPVVGDRGVSRVQPRGHRPVVRRERVLRAGKPCPWRSTPVGRADLVRPAQSERHPRPRVLAPPA